jgi:hypothetical protein
MATAVDFFMYINIYTTHTFVSSRFPLRRISVLNNPLCIACRSRPRGICRLRAKYLYVYNNKIYTYIIRVLCMRLKSWRGLHVLHFDCHFKTLCAHKPYYMYIYIYMYIRIEVEFRLTREGFIGFSRYTQWSRD